jgi:hypothetical protein
MTVVLALLAGISVAAIIEGALERFVPHESPATVDPDAPRGALPLS